MDLLSFRAYPKSVDAALKAAQKGVVSPFWIPADALDRAGGRPKSTKHPTTATFSVDTLLYNAVHLPACGQLPPLTQAKHVVWASGAWQPAVTGGQLESTLTLAAKRYGFQSGRWARAKHLPPSIPTSAPPVAVTVAGSRRFYHISEIDNLEAVLNGRWLPRYHFWGATGSILHKASFTDLAAAAPPSSESAESSHAVSQQHRQRPGAMFTSRAWFRPHELKTLGLQPCRLEVPKVRVDVLREFVCYPMTPDAFTAAELQLLSIAAELPPTIESSAALREQLVAFGGGEDFVAVLTRELDWVIGSHKSLRAPLPPGVYVEAAAVEQLVPRLGARNSTAAAASKDPPPMAHVAFMERVTPWNLEQLEDCPPKP